MSQSVTTLGIELLSQLKMQPVGAEMILSGFGKFGKLVINMGMHDVSDKDFMRNGEYEKVEMYRDASLRYVSRCKDSSQ